MKTFNKENISLIHCLSNKRITALGLTERMKYEEKCFGLPVSDSSKIQISLVLLGMQEENRDTARRIGYTKFNVSSIFPSPKRRNEKCIENLGIIVMA